MRAQNAEIDLGSQQVSTRARRRSNVVKFPPPFWVTRMRRAAKLLRGRELNVCVALISHCWRRDVDAYPSEQTLAEITGINRRHIGPLIRKIEAAGLIKAERSPGVVTVYTFNDQEPETAPSEGPRPAPPTVQVEPAPEPSESPTGETVPAPFPTPTCTTHGARRETKSPKESGPESFKKESSEENASLGRSAPLGAAATAEATPQPTAKQSLNRHVELRADRRWGIKGFHCIPMRIPETEP
jgi:hypothetical protein